MNFHPNTLDDSIGPRNFKRLAELIEGHTGIRMPPAKRTMLEGRLRRRVSALGLADLDAYCRFLFEGGLDQEFHHLVDVVTTNKTDFFREPDHFAFLVDKVVPELAGQESLSLWSAAAANGAEAYTLAMVLAHLARHGRSPSFLIQATDICGEVLAEAERAVYPEEMIAPVPAELRRECLLRSRRREARLVRIAPELRRLVRFQRLNLLDDRYPWSSPFDVVFCRNVLIYFAKPTQEIVLGHICRHLRPGGYLFVGHSETLAGLDLPLTPVAAAVYRRL